MTKQKMIVVLPEGGEAASKPKYTCCVENSLGLRDLAKQSGIDIVVTANKDGADSELDKNLSDATIIVTTPFHPAYLTRERMEKAKELKLVLVAGIGSDHIDLHAAADNGVTVAEITGSNVVSVAEDEVLRTLALLRNFVPAYEQIQHDDWNVPKVAVDSWDLQGKTVGTIGGGAIGYHYMLRLRTWDVKRLYYGRHEKPDMDKEGVTLVKDLDEFLGQCDVVTVNVPLTDKTRGMLNKETLPKMKKGSYLINNARGAIVDREAAVEAVKSGQIKGYSGDVWDEQPAPKDHPWRHTPGFAMTAHTSGTTLDAQVRYQEGIHKLLKAYLEGKDLPEDDLIVKAGELASQYS